MRFHFSIAAVATCLLLSGCAYIQDQSYQKLTIETPGAVNAICHVTIDKLKYVFYPPETQTVIKHGKPMEVACMAPGNRDKTIMVEAGAIFKYPETVYVDFNAVPVSNMPLPHHNNPDIKQPEEYVLEEFLPGNPMMNKDKNATQTTLQRKDSYDDFDVDARPALGKGDLSNVRTQTGGGYYAGQ